MKKFISVLIVVLVLITSTVFARDYAQRFWDVPKDYWGFEYIADLTERGVIKGYEDGSFKPENIVLRSEWAKMMVTAAGLSVNDNGTYFTDTNGHWANSYINTAKNYLTGYSDGSYRPDQAATREDVTVAMVKLKGYDLSDVDYSYLNTFRDVDSISNYAKGYVAVAIKNNLISGFEDNTFRGQDTLTRAEAATLMYRAFKHGNADKVTTTPTTPITSDTSKSNEDYAKQAEPKYEEPKQETKKTETKSEEPKTEVTNDEPQEEEKAQPHYEVTTLATWSDISDEIGKDTYNATAITKYKNGIAILAENCVISVDTKGNTTLLYNFDDMPTGDVFGDNCIKATAMGYDESNERLLVCAGYRSDDAIYEVSSGSAEKVSDSPEFKNELYILNNGNIVAGGGAVVAGNGGIYSGKNYENVSKFYRFLPNTLYDNGEYLTFSQGQSILIWDYTSDEPYYVFSESCDGTGVYDDNLIIATKGNKAAKVWVQDETSESFEIKVKDSKNLEKINYIITVDKNGSFIFSDYSNKAYRYAEFIEE